ncbi:MAG: hypothetical protein AAF364_13730 [Pseudomonadota bacterium]
MSTFIFSLNDISVSDDSPVVSVNNTDSFFGLIKGSQLFIAGKLPATIEDHDTTARTITLRENWAQGDLNSVAATVVPIGAVSTLLQALENNRAAYQAFLENAGGGGSGNGGEISWSVIIDPPPTATQWPTWTQVQGDINEVLPEPAKRFPNFPEIGGKVSVDQLPDDIDTDNKRTRALSPPIKREKSFNQILSDYPTLKKTEVRPTESPNNKRLIQFDDVRGEVHVALTDRWFTIPTTIASRSFPIFYRGLILRFNNNSSYTGNIKMRVYPMGKGGLGLPNNPPFINDHEWQEYETSVTNLYKIGEFNSEYFEGIIEYIELDNGWHQFDVNQSDVGSLNAKFDTAFGTLRSPFRTFYQKADGYWYSEDMFPENLHSIGASWAQDANNPRVFTVTEATASNDALRFFSDSFDDFQFEMILDVSYVAGTLALTVSNVDPNKVYFQGPARFITDERVYFKRAGSSVTAALTVESLKMRIPHYE